MTQTTRRTALRTTLGLAALALFALPGCGGGDSNVVAPPVLASTARTASNLELTVSLPKSTFARGEDVSFTMTVKNVSTRTLPVQYSDPSALPLIKQGSNIIWALSGGASSVREARLAPGQVLRFSSIWRQTQNPVPGETLVPAGGYTLQGWFDAISVNEIVVGGVEQALSTLYTNPVSFTVLP